MTLRFARSRPTDRATLVFMTKRKKTGEALQPARGSLRGPERPGPAASCPKYPHRRSVCNSPVNVEGGNPLPRDHCPPTCFLKPDHDLEIWKRSEDDGGVLTSDSFSLYFCFFGAVGMTHDAKTQSTKKRKGAVLSTVTRAACETPTCLSAVARVRPWSSEGPQFPSPPPASRGRQGPVSLEAAVVLGLPGGGL